MIEELLYEYLNDVLDVPVYTEMPSGDVPSEFVMFERTGGSVENMLKSAVVAIQSHAETLYAAAALNETVKTAMDELVYSVDDVSACRLNTDYNYTDGTTRDYRYQAVYQLFYY